MESSHKKAPPPSQLSRMLQVAARAPLSLSTSNQPHALLPTGNSVPLASEAFYTWISLALAENGFHPGASQLGHLIRQLDAEAHLTNRFESIHLRSLKTAPESYKFDLATPSCEVIELTSKGWSITSDFDTRFFRPDGSIPFPHPDRIKNKFHDCLEKLLHLPSEKAKLLATWCIHALLPDKTPPPLIITGKERLDATAKLRALLDPAMCPMQLVPSTTQKLVRLALTNKVMVFNLNDDLTKKKIKTLNSLRTGLLVELKQMSKHRDPVTYIVQRPVIITAEEAPEIHAEQLAIEVNETGMVDIAQLFAALLTAASKAIPNLEAKPKAILELQRSAPNTEGPQISEPDPQDPGP